MSITYFLGANSRRGFYSLYEEFPPGSDTMLHIIKGGPGTGKSSFMRKIASEAERRGLKVEYVLCSGDPDSLDGIYIPALNQAWCDGTSPHVTEPGIFGLDSDYVNLGSFCRLPLSDDDKARSAELNRDYKAAYARSYKYLAAAAELRDAAAPGLFTNDLLAHVKKRVAGILSRNCGKTDCDPSPTTRRFLSAVSCRGCIRLTDSVLELCKLIYCFDDGLLGAAAALDIVRRECETRGLPVLLCPDPLSPDCLEAVLIPELSLGFLSGDWGIEQSRHLRIDKLPTTDRLRAFRPELRRAMAAYQTAMDLALEKLSQAKAIHDKLEQVYRPHMDFEALDKFTAKQLKQIFK